MSERTSLPTGALIVASAMSRFDDAYLRSRTLTSWRGAFQEAAECFDRPWTSMKASRDEFDVHFPNSRRGWSKLEVRPPIRRTILEIEPLSQDLHMEFVRCALSDRIGELAPVIAVLDPPLDATAVAKRLLTGRLAEEWFREQAPTLFPLAAQGLIDCRTDAKGFDFAVAGDAATVIEVKGIAGESGSILFTEREWMTALERKAHYWLAVVSHVYATPQLRAIPDPASALAAARYERSTLVSEWRATFYANRYPAYV